MKQEKETVFFLNEKIKNRERVALALVVSTEGTTPAKPGIIMVVTENGMTKGTVGGGETEFSVIEKSIECIKSRKNCYFTVESKEPTLKDSDCSKIITVFIKTFNKNPNLIIIGAGHVAYSLYKVAKTQTFDLHVIDSRKELCNKKRFKKAQIYNGDMLESLDSIGLDSDSYIVIAGPNHQLDEEALKSVISKEFKYIGMLGSKNKIESIKNRMRESGYSEERLNLVHSPIGLNLGSNNPNEIAVGIIAEIIKVKNS